LVAKIAHQLGVKPADVRWVLVCVTNDTHWAVGSEVDINTIQNGYNSTYPVFTRVADTTNIWLVLDTFNATHNLLMDDPVTGNYYIITNADWRAKCYAWP